MLSARKARFTRLEDERGKRVVFVSHCLLDENVRYLAGPHRPLMRRRYGAGDPPC